MNSPMKRSGHDCEIMMPTVTPTKLHGCQRVLQQPAHFILACDLPVWSFTNNAKKTNRMEKKKRKKKKKK